MKRKLFLHDPCLHPSLIEALYQMGRLSRAEKYFCIAAVKVVDRVLRRKSRPEAKQEKRRYVSRHRATLITNILKDPTAAAKELFRRISPGGKLRVLRAKRKGRIIYITGYRANIDKDYWGSDMRLHPYLIFETSDRPHYGKWMAYIDVPVMQELFDLLPVSYKDPDANLFRYLNAYLTSRQVKSLNHLTPDFIENIWVFSIRIDYPDAVFGTDDDSDDNYALKD